MIPLKKPEWEITLRHAGNVVMAIPLAVGFALVLWKFSPWRVISPTLGIIVFAVSAIAFALVFYWILEWFWNRPDELRKKIPITSQELRQRTRRFYDSLPKE